MIVLSFVFKTVLKAKALNPQPYSITLAVISHQQACYINLYYSLVPISVNKVFTKRERHNVIPDRVLNWHLAKILSGIFFSITKLQICTLFTYNIAMLNPIEYAKTLKINTIYAFQPYSYHPIN